MPQKLVKLLKIAKWSLIMSLSKWLHAPNLTFMNTKDVILPDYKSADSRYKYFSWYEHLKMRFLLKMADFLGFSQLKKYSSYEVN